MHFNSFVLLGYIFCYPIWNLADILGPLESWLMQERVFGFWNPNKDKIVKIIQVSDAVCIRTRHLPVGWWTQQSSEQFLIYCLCFDFFHFF